MINKNEGSTLWMRRLRVEICSRGRLYLGTSLKFPLSSLVVTHWRSIFTFKTVREKWAQQLRQQQHTQYSHTQTLPIP